jgi:hypothetical protein
MKVLSALAGLIGIVSVLFVVALVNGGFVYRVQCPRTGGSTETEWTYRWSSVIPYVGYSRSGCETHSATRVALDAIGVWDLGGASLAESSVDHSSAYPPEAVSSMTDQCVKTGATRSFCGCATDEITRRLSPDEFNQVATAIQAGATTYNDLPGDVRQKIQDAATAAEADCR